MNNPADTARTSELITTVSVRELSGDILFTKDTTTNLTKEYADSIIMDFVKTMPYPTYEEMLETLDNRIDLWSEYSEYNHMCCKIIYENPTNKNVIVEMGKKIHAMGGMQSLFAHYLTYI